MDSGAAAQSGLWSKFPSPCLYACVYVAWGWCAETLMHLGCLLSSADCRYLMCRGNSKEPEHQVQARDPLHCGGQCPASQSSSVAQSCPTLCPTQLCPLQASLSITNSWSLLKLMPIESVMPSAISSSVVPFSSCLHSFPASGSFPMSQFFVSGGQNIGVSAPASVPPMNIQD